MAPPQKRRAVRRDLVWRVPAHLPRARGRPPGARRREGAGIVRLSAWVGTSSSVRNALAHLLFPTGLDEFHDVDRLVRQMTAGIVKGQWLADAHHAGIRRVGAQEVRVAPSSRRIRRVPSTLGRSGMDDVHQLSRMYLRNEAMVCGHPQILVHVKMHAVPGDACALAEGAIKGSWELPVARLQPPRAAPPST